jgi:hypothetical protein
MQIEKPPTDTDYLKNTKYKSTKSQIISKVEGFCEPK